MTTAPASIPVTSIWRPSTARRVTLDSLLPSPRGSGAGTPTALTWPTKDPGDVLDYEVDIAPAIAGSENDGIAAVGVSITPNATGDLVASTVLVDGTTVVVWLSGGVAGTIYVVQLIVTTNSGRVIKRSILAPVQSLSSLVAPASALTTAAGAIVTDQSGNPILLGS